MKKNLKLILVFTLLVTLISCKKTHDKIQVTETTSLTNRIFLNKPVSDVFILLNGNNLNFPEYIPAVRQHPAGKPALRASCSQKTVVDSYNCNTGAYQISGNVCFADAEYVDWTLVRNNVNYAYAGTTNGTDISVITGSNFPSGSYYFKADIYFFDINGALNVFSTTTSVINLIAKPTGTVDGAVPFFRYFNGTNHFYTNNWCELGSGVQGINYEGIQCYVYSSQVSGSVPFYRFSKPGDYFYVTNYTDGSSNGYSFDGVACYVFTSQVSSTMPLYRFSQGQRHFYTTDYSEGVNAGLSFDGIACYVK